MMSCLWISLSVWPHRFITYLVIVSLVFIYGLMQFRKLDPRYKVLVALIGLGIGSDLVSRLFASLVRYSMPGYHIYIPLQYLLITLFYSTYLKGGRGWFTYSPLLILVATMINTVYFQSIWTIPSNVVLISSLIYIVYSFFTFKQLLTDASGTPLLQLDIFWCNVAVLAYFTCTFFCWSFYNFFVKNHINTGLIAIIIYFANYVYYLTLGYAIVLNSKRKQYVE